MKDKIAIAVTAREILLCVIGLLFTNAGLCVTVASLVIAWFRFDRGIALATLGALWMILGELVDLGVRDKVIQWLRRINNQQEETK